MCLGWGTLTLLVFSIQRIIEGVFIPVVSNFVHLRWIFLIFLFFIRDLLGTNSMMGQRVA